MSARRLLPAAVAALAVALPRLVLACPVCMAADARRESAYIGTTVLLSLLPLFAIGGIGWLVWRRSGARDVAAPGLAPPAAARAEGPTAFLSPTSAPE